MAEEKSENLQTSQLYPQYLEVVPAQTLSTSMPCLPNWDEVEAAGRTENPPEIQVSDANDAKGITAEEGNPNKEKNVPADLPLNTEEGDGAASFYIGEVRHPLRSPSSPLHSLASSYSSLNDKGLLSPDKIDKPPELPKSPPEFVPPDGGYGWVVVIAACVVNMWIVGFIKSYSLLYLEIINEFPDSSAYHASWIPALLSTIGLLTGEIYIKL